MCRENLLKALKPAVTGVCCLAGLSKRHFMLSAPRKRLGPEGETHCAYLPFLTEEC